MPAGGGHLGGSEVHAPEEGQGLRQSLRDPAWRLNHVGGRNALPRHAGSRCAALGSRLLDRAEERDRFRPLHAIRLFEVRDGRRVEALDLDALPAALWRE